MVVQFLTSTTDFIRDVKNRVTIRLVVEFYGFTPNRQHMISCPFHSEKTPSCYIDDERDTFYCFGCQTGGDSIKFIEKLYDLTPYKAALKLNSDLGLNIRPPTTKTSQNTPAPKPKERPLTEYEKQKIREKWGLDTCDILSDYLKMLKQFSEERPQHDSNGQPMTNWKFTAYCHDYPITTYIVDCLLEKKKRDTIIDHWHDTAERLKNNFMKNLKREREEKQNADKSNT